MEYLIRLFERTLINSLEAAAMIVAIALLLRVFRRRLSPAWQYALWLLILVKLLLPWLPGHLEIELRWFSLPDAIGSQISSGYSEGGGQPAAEEISTETEGSTGNIAQNSAATVVETSATGRQSPSAFVGALAILWLFGTAIAWLLLASGHLRTLMALRRETATAVPQELNLLFKRLIHECGIRSRVQIRLTGLVSAPALFGIIFPAVLIPSHLIRQLSPKEWECMIRHELAHLKRRDIPVNLLAYVLASVHWFNPAVWYAMRSMRIHQETACDASVLSSSDLKETYAASIIKLLEIGASRTTVSVGVGFYGTKNQIKRRIVMIHHYKPSGKNVSFVGVAILVAAALFTLPSAFASGKGDSAANAADQPATTAPAAKQNETSPVKISFVTPTAGKLASPYGDRIHPITSKKTLHDGIDIANKKGTKVFAAADGKVIKAERDSKYGLTIKIEHNPKWTTEYRHLDKLSVEEGATVESGDLIGLMGSTGNSTGSHLHFSMISDGEYIDPMSVIKKWKE